MFLRLVHATDGVPGTQKRIAAVARILPDFGIATERGMTRARSVEQVMDLLEVQADAAG